MSKPGRYHIFEPAQLRGLLFLFAALLLLGMGQVFKQGHPHNPEAASIAFQAHTQACHAALLADKPLSRKDTRHSFQNTSDGGLFTAFSPISSSRDSLLSGQVSETAGFTPHVKRCILFSCLRMGDPPVV